MDLKTLRIEHPEVFAEAVKLGVNEERARRNELNAYVEADPDNERVVAVVNEAIANGQTVADINARLQVAIRDGGKLDGENPPEIPTASAATTEDQQVEDLLDEVRGGRG